jgi:tripartite motif-containing protein 71
MSIGSAGSGDGQFDSPSGVDVDGDGNLYVADTSNHRVQKLAADGTFLTKWGSRGAGIGEFDAPHCVTVDGEGNVYVTDWVNSRIQKFAPA